jgi:hypothetical protein
MTDEDNTQLVEASSEILEGEEVLLASTEEISARTTEEPVEEIRADTPAPPVTLQTQKEVASPLLSDPYEFSQCTITIVYTLFPDGNVSVSVHSHKDAPVVKTFSETEVSLPERVSCVMNTLREIWPGSEVSATFALLPQDEAAERTVTVSVRVNRDTPLVQSFGESELSFPAPILAMLEELKALLPGRAMECIQKAAKSARNTKRKPTAVTSTAKPVTTESSSRASVPSNNQMSLF